MLRRSLRLPITLAVAMFLLLAALTVGWVLLAVSGALTDASYAGLYWTILSIGSTFMLFLVLGVVLYLVLSIKTINLTNRQSNFIDSVTHELKSPITSMKLHLQTLNRHEMSQPERVKFYRVMLEDVERLDRLTSQVLEAGRLETGREDGDAEEIDLADLLRECVGAVCLRYRTPAATVRVDASHCTVRARRVDLEMIFRNLIDNAVKYAGTPPQVELTVRPQTDGFITTRISDNGPRIPPKLRRKIFGRFVRLGNELERQRTGTGLGLYIVRTLVKRLNGRIRVFDLARDAGTVFEVRLPGRSGVGAVAGLQEDRLPASSWSPGRGRARDGREEAHPGRRG